MIYLLIDNCTLRDLIDKNGYSRYLAELESLISENKVEFVTHELVIAEWNKHKLKWKQDKERKLLGPHNQNNAIANHSKSVLPFGNMVSADHIALQINQIDRFLNNAKLILVTPDIISNEFSERYRKGKAPFHRKKNSQNDWEILGTFCNYCEINGIKELYFLSSNHTDFADETEKTIHPDFKERFPRTYIHYFKNYYEFFDEVKSINGISVSLIPYRLIPNKKYSYKTTIRKTVLDSLMFLYEDLYSEINFIPTHIIKKYYPFASSENSNVYYSQFTLSYVSENLISFLENVLINNKNEIEFKDEVQLSGIDNYKEKIYLILRKLNSNLIFHLVGEKSGKRVCSHYNNPIKCNCYRCSFNRFEFQKTFRDLKIKENNYKEKLKQAYIHSQVGNFLSANDIYEDILKTALNDKKFLTYFIAKYNEKHLADFLRNPFFNKKVDNSIVEELSAIDKLEEAVKLKTHTDYDLLSYISQEEFFTNAFQNIREATNEIVIHYHSQLKGGWSSNRHILDLMDGFATLESFLNSNYIIYDNYSNFNKLFENVVEGIFASYAISKNQHERFKAFDNYWVSKFIMYGNRASIVKLFNRYNLQSLKYESNNNGDSLFELANNLLLSKRELNITFEKYADKNNEYFEKKCSDLFDNILTMVSILEIRNSPLNDLANVILSYLKENLPLSHTSNAALTHFINEKGKLLTQTIKYDFLTWSLNNENCHDNHLLSILEIFEDESIKKVSEKNFYHILNLSTDVCTRCEQRHGYEILACLYAKVSTARKKIISIKIADLLKIKFDFNLYYIASIYRIINFDKNILQLFVSEYRVSKNRRSFRSLFSNSIDFQDSTVDRIINLCFKFNIDTSGNNFAKLKKINPYYEWLLNMDKFDYSNFNPEWVLNYQTTYYLKAMSKSTNLIKALRSFLSDKFHVGIERMLLRLTNFSPE